MSTPTSREIKAVLSLDEKRARATINASIGKYGAGWVLDVIREYFQQMMDGSDDAPDGYRCTVQARIQVLRGLIQYMFEFEKPS